VALLNDKPELVEV